MVALVAWMSGLLEPKVGDRVSDWSGEIIADSETEEVHEVTKEYIEEAVGTFKSASRTVISSKILAAIQEITVSAGDLVEEGDLLIRLDDQDLAARLKQAEQGLIAATATRKEAELSFARYEQLQQRNATSVADLDRARRAMEVAKAEEFRAEQAVNEAQVMMSYSMIIAPKAGRVVDRLAEPGDNARPGEPLLVLYDETTLRLEAPVLERLAVKLSAGDTMKVYVDALQQEIEGTIDEIVPQADAPSRSFLVKVRVPHSANLYEGMFGRLRIPAGVRKHVCLATDAIVQVGQLQFVDVVNEDESTERRLIKTGRLGMPGRVEVLSGLKPGERVVIQDARDN